MSHREEHALTVAWNRLGSVLLRNLQVVDPAGGPRGTCDLWIKDGVLEAMAPGLPADSAPAVDFDGAVVMPGLFDMHVHFREPGGEESKQDEVWHSPDEYPGSDRDVMGDFDGRLVKAWYGVLWHRNPSYKWQWHAAGVAPPLTRWRELKEGE